MRVLIACEFSAVVRDALRASGHDAWSCDLLPTEGNPAFHIQGDCFKAIESRDWDLLIFHYPCTNLCNSGVRWLYGKGTKQMHYDAKRWQAMERDATNFRRLLESKVPRICGENPIPHRYASAIMGPYTQTIQPWQFGHGEVKRTCLWLRGLPPLVPSNIVEGRTPRVHHASPGPNRWKERSRTLPGIAKAMAEQFTRQ